MRQPDLGELAGSTSLAALGTISERRFSFSDLARAWPSLLRLGPDFGLSACPSSRSPVAIRAAMIPASIGLAGRVSPNPLLVITGQCRRNARAGEPLADGIATKGSVVIADKAYDSDRIHKSLAASGIIAVIPSRVNRLNPYPVDEAAYRMDDILADALAQFRNTYG